jgi:DNA-binding MarR family transcriptional regulator
MSREGALQQLFGELGLLLRRARELTVDGDLGLAQFTFLNQIDARPGTRAADLAALFGLDKSTVSRQVDRLSCAGLIAKCGEQPGRRGQRLELTESGRTALSAALQSRRVLLAELLTTWDEHDIASLASLLGRLNEGANRG